MAENERLKKIIWEIKAKYGLKTQKEIADWAEINVTHLSEMLSGQARITDKNSGELNTSSEKLCKRFGLNPAYILNGEGGVWLDSSPITQVGDNNIAGNNNQVGSPSTIESLLNEIAEQRKLVAKSQEQIDRLIGLLEKFK